MKRVLPLLVLVCLITSCLPSYIYKKQRLSVHIDGFSYYLVPETNYAEVVGHHRYEDTIAVNLPETIIHNNKKYTVVKVEGFSFAGHNLTSITIPNSVTSIGYGAFSLCSGLISVTIPNSVTSIGEEAFYACTGLTSVTIPNSVTSIGDSAFIYCTSLHTITIPKDMNVLKAFKHCPMLTNIQFTEGIDSLVVIDQYAFAQGVLPICIIPDNVTSIGLGAFSQCKNLHTVTIPTSVKNIEKYAFYGCKSLNTIHYEGTVEQWNQIAKDKNWSMNTPAFQVKCTDGQVMR